MPTYAWFRQYAIAQDISDGSKYSLYGGYATAGQSIVRTRFGISVNATSSARQTAYDPAPVGLLYGCYSTPVISGAAVYLDPTTPTADLDPPMQRWLYWRSAPLVLAAADGELDVAHWNTVASADVGDSRGMVLANVSGSNNVSVFLTARLSAPWSGDGGCVISAWSETLVELTR